MLPSLSDCLLVDADGTPTRPHVAMESSEWDEITSVMRDLYTPFRVRPTGRGTPDAFLYTWPIGGFTLARFSFGTGVVLDEFDRGAGMGGVLTTIGGRVLHQSEATTAIGESFAVDVDRTHYLVEGDDDHAQLNLTYPHDLLAELYERWHGVPADPAMWQLSFKFGGEGSSWLALLEYCSRCIAEMPDQVATGPLGRQLEEMLGIHLLNQWSSRFNDPTYDKPNRGLAPRYVAAAEAYLREHARSAPTLSEVADAVGVSVRALTNAYRRYRDQPPIAQLREIRMNGVRADLVAADPATTVASVLNSWGYVNHGVFARAYRKRFGEKPSATLGRLRRRGQ